MKKRPDFKSYLKYHYRKILGTAYESKPITCRSGKEYAIVNSTLFKVLRAFILGIAIIFNFMPKADNILNTLIPVASFWGTFEIIKLLKYLLARYEPLDDTDNLSLENASTAKRPRFWDYVKRETNNERTLHNIFESNDGQKYCESSAGRAYFNAITKSIICLLIAAVLILWMYIGTCISMISNIAIFFAMIILYLLISPLEYFLLDFRKLSQHYNNATIQDLSNEKKPRPLLKKFLGVTLFLIIVELIALVYIVDIGSLLTTTTKSKIPIEEQTTFEEAFELAHAYADAQCGDAGLVGFSIRLADEKAIKMREPSDWKLHFQDPPTGLFTDLNQTVYIAKNTETEMITFHHNPAPTKSMYNAPILPLDVDEILTILETDLGVCFKNTKSSIIVISGGSKAYKYLPPNTVRVWSGGQTYIVDIVNKTAWEK